MALASKIWNALGKVAAKEQKEQTVMAQQAIEKARKTSVDSIMAANDKIAIDTADAKRNAELRPARDRAYMPYLINMLEKYEALLKTSKTTMGDFAAQAKETLDVLQSTDSYLSVSYNDLTQRESCIALLKRKPEIILHSADSLDDETREEMKALGMNVSDKTSGESIHKHDIKPQLEAFLPPARFSIVIDHYGDALPVSLLRLELARIGANKSIIMFQDSREDAYSYEKPLTAPNLAQCLETLTRWEVRRSPQILPALQQKITDIGKREADKELHMRIYGHLNFLINEDDDAEIAKSKLNAHFAVAVPHLRKAAEETYDLLPRPTNDAFLKAVAKDVKSLNGVKIADGRRLKVNYDRRGGDYHTLTIETENSDKTFHTIPERFELRWSGVADRFDSLTTGAKGVKNTMGPQEYHFDTQYHFAHEQVGAWLKILDETIATSFITAKEDRAIYAAPQNYRIAGYKKPVLAK